MTSRPSLHGGLPSPPFAAQPASASRSVSSDGRSNAPKLARVCTKLALQGQANDKCARYTLFLKVSLPASNRAQTYPLLPDANVRLRSSTVDALDDSGAASPSSLSAVRAASQLGIPLSMGPEGTLSRATEVRSATPSRRPSVGERQISSFNAPAMGHLPKVTVANFHISLVAPPNSSSSSTSGYDAESTSSRVASTAGSAKGPTTSGMQSQVKTTYLVTLQLEVAIVQRPPKWPFLVKLPVPRCLNNFLHFTIDTAGASTEGIAVEIDPPLLPRIRRRRKTPARSSSPSLSDQSADEDGTRSAFGGEGDEDEDTDDDEAVSGPFPAAEHVVIRWAAPNAGLLIAQRADLSAAHEGAGMLRVEGFDSRLQVALADKLALAKARKKISDSDILLDVEWTCSVRGAHYPGLDQEACLHLLFDSFEQRSKLIAVKVDAPSGLVRWLHHVGHSMSGSASMSSLNDHSHASLGHAKAINAEAPLRQPPDDWTMAGDDNDVLHIAPPSGLADTDMDMSFEVGTSHTELVRHKRHSLSGQNPRGNTPAPIAEEEASGPDDAAEGIRLFVDVPTVCGRNGAEPETTFQFTIKGLIALTPEMNASPLREEDLPISFALPVFRTPDIASQRCTIGLRATESLQHIGRVLEVARWPQLARPERGATHLQEVVLVDLAPSPPPVRPPPGHGFDPEACVLALRALALPHIAVESDVATLPSPQLLSSSIASDAISQDTLEPIDALRTIIASATVEVWPCKQQLEGEAGSRPRTVHRLTASWPSTKPAQAQDASLMSTCIIGFSHGRASVRTAQADLALPNPLSILGAFVNGRCISTEQQLPGESEQVIPALDAAVNQDTAAAASSTPYILQIPLPTAIDTGTSEVKLELLYALDTMEEQAGEIALPVFTAEVLSFRVDVHSPEGSEELDVTTSDFRYVTSSGDIGRSNMTTLQRFNLPPLTVCVARLGTRKVDLPVLPVRETSPASVPSSSPARPSGLARVAQITAVPHLVWTVFITLFFAWVFVHLAQPLETLSRRVELVSMAVGVDDTDGSWQAGDVPGSEQAWEDTLKRAHHAGALAGWKSPSQFQTPDDWHRSNRNGQNAPSLTSPISGSWQAEEAIGSPASKAPIAAAASPEAASVTMPDRLSSKHQDDFPEFGGTQAPTELATTNINPLSALRELLLAPFTITLRGAGVLSAVLGRLLGLNS